MEQVIDGRTYLQNAHGGLVPIESVKPIDQLRNQTVQHIHTRLKRLREMMEEEKRHCMEEINIFTTIAAQEYGIKLGGERGNLTLQSYDGTIRISLNIQDRQDFNEGILAAKKLIDDCLADWTKDSAADLRNVVTKAFKVKQGKMDVKRILELRSINVEDARWKQAMDIIAESLITTSSKLHFRMHERNGEAYQMVNLDFSDL